MADTQLTFGRTDDYVFISKPKKGIAYVEARFKDGVGLAQTDKGCQQLLATLEREWSPPKLNDDTVISLETDLLKEPVFYKYVPSHMFHSLRVVEFQGLDPSTRVVSIRDVAIKVNLYGFTAESPSVSDDEFETMLPNSKFDGLWELLVVDHAVKSQLSQWLGDYIKTCLAPQPPFPPGLLGSIILLLGPVGSGKSTMARALAQKVSIRLYGKYHKILLLEPGSRQMFNFDRLARRALQEPSHLHVLVFDDVESIAWSLKRKGNENRLAPSVRATNSTLTGLDILDVIPNVLIISTSRMGSMLDEGFLDRCGITATLTWPKCPERYEILKRQFQALVDAGTISCGVPVPVYRDAVLQSLSSGEEANPGPQILILARSIRDGTSARFLCNVVARALMSHLLHLSCDMTTAVKLVSQSINQHNLKDREDFVNQHPEANAKEPVRSRPVADVMINPERDDGCDAEKQDAQLRTAKDEVYSELENANSATIIGRQEVLGSGDSAARDDSLDCLLEEFVDLAEEYPIAKRRCFDRSGQSDAPEQV